MNNLKIVLVLILFIYGCNSKGMKATTENINNTPVYEAELLYEIPAELGEGAFWNYETRKLWWVDIEKRKLNIYDPAEKINQEINVEERIGTVVPDKNGNAIIALQTGLFRMNLETEEKELICNPLSNPEIRFNDGKCDPAGRLWVGSMHLKFVNGAASLYRIEDKEACKEVFGGVTISNGIIWSNDHATLYYIDTPKKTVRAWDYNNETGAITNERIVITVPDNMGGPDGMTIDAEGMLWVAHWGGNMVGRWNPQNGALIGKVEVPAPNVTSCAFGGPNLDLLYITTAGGEKDKYPLAGSLFVAKTGIKGVKGTFYAY